MERVNFRCGHCNQLIAVSAAHLGQQVRCPHCQKVVLAPGTTSPPVPAALPPPPPPAPPASSQTLEQTFAISPPPVVRDEEHDSIFTAPTQGDDIFGPSSSPRVQYPTEVMEQVPDRTEQIPAPNLELTATEAPTGRVPSPPDATLTYVPNEPARGSYAPASEQTLPNDFSVPPPAPEPAPWSPHSDRSDEASPDAATAAILAKPRSRGGWHIALIIIPLISYAILATIAAGMLWFRQQQKPPNPMESMPDIEGEFPTNLKGNKRAVLMGVHERNLRVVPSIDTPLSKELKVQLGKTITLGELEITPERLERRNISVMEKGKTQAHEPKGKSLLLHLRLKNLSKDLAYHPMDRYFTRFYSQDRKRASMRLSTADRPYTYLEIGNKKYFGGPAGYYDLDFDRTNKNNYLNEYVVGQDFDRKLKPGEEMTTFICTDPEDPALSEALAKHEGPLLWRVQVRRGSVILADRRIPVTAVIGVEFDANDLKGKS